MKKSLKASLIAVAIASFPFGSQAAGLGQINVLSGLGQPLRAEIQINASPQELQSLRARIGSPESFRQANVPYSPVIPTLRVAVENRGSRSVVKLSTDRPVSDPFVDLLLELDWEGGRLSREYTFLLDPVDLGAPRALGARVDTPAAAPVPRSPRAEVAPRAPAVPAAAGAASADAGSYRVQRGDTLRRIADNTRPADASLDQMLVALFRANPAAFEGNNINRLKAGAILTVPPASTVQGLDPQAARREVLAQSADFDAYRRRLASSAVERPAEGQVEQAAGGRIVPRVDAPASTPSGDKLKVSRTQSGETAAGTEVANRLQSLEEELVSREKALDEANARLAQLEQNIRELQKLLQLKSESLAQAQAAAGGAPAPATTPAPAPAAPAPADTPPAASAPTPGAEAPAAAVTPATPPAESKPAEAPKPKPKKVVPPPEPEPEPGFLESMLGNPTILAAGGGILALLLAYAGLRMRGRSAKKNETDSAALISEFPPESSGVFGATGGQSVDTSNSSVIHTDFSQSGLSAIDADEGVDPVAEADVYMAYGRDAQAEEILLDALKADPERLAIPLKLLEIYSKRKSAKQFESIASELYARTGGKGLDWEKTALMGRKLDPDNPLYSSKTVEPERTEAPSTEMPAAPLAAAGVAGAAAAAAALEAAEQDAPEAPALANLDFTTSMSGVSNPQELTATWTEGVGQIGADAPEAPAEEPAADEQPVSMDVNLDALDFDLELDAPTPAAAPAAAAAPDLAATSDLMLNLDLGGDTAPLGQGEEVDSAAPGNAAETGTVTVIGQDLDFAAADDAGLTFDLPELSAPAPQADSPDLNATVVQADALEFGGDAAATTDLEATSFDSNLLDFDFDLDTPAATAAPAAPAAGLDLTSIDLNLEPPADADLGFDVPPSVDELPALDGTAATVDGGIDQEVETKLELARAYEEMGDKDGARELLDEVVREGTPTQQAAARELIARLA